MANVGDSPAMLATRRSESTKSKDATHEMKEAVDEKAYPYLPPAQKDWKGVAGVLLTEEHNVPALTASERLQIEKKGGCFLFSAQGPFSYLASREVGRSIAMTRSLGDLGFHNVGVLTSKPYVKSFSLDTVAGKDREPAAVLLASDGLWDALPTGANGSANVAARYLDSAPEAKRCLAEPWGGGCLRHAVKHLAEIRSPAARNAMLPWITRYAKAGPLEEKIYASQRKDSPWSLGDDVTLLLALVPTKSTNKKGKNVKKAMKAMKKAYILRCKPRSRRT